jgi:hypothetical protein
LFIRIIDAGRLVIRGADDQALLRDFTPPFATADTLEV